MRPSANSRQALRNNCSSSDKTVSGTLISTPRGASMPVAPKKIAYYNSPQHRLYLSLVMDSDSHAKGHDQGHRHDVARSARGSLKIALIITSTFLVAEFLGALYTNS